MKTNRGIGAFALALLAAACSSSDSSDPVAVSPPLAAGAPAAGAASPLAWFEGSVDVANKTMTVITRLPSGEVLPATTLPYGTATGDVYFHTCSVSYTAGSKLSGTVQAVNLGGANTTSAVNAVIDSVSETGVTLGSGSGSGSASGIIATYATATSTVADCSSTQPWVFNLPGAANFTFIGHADGTPPGGNDGPLSVSSATTFSTPSTHLASAAAAGATSLSVVSASGFSVGDRLLVINVRSSSGNAGLWELKPVTGLTGTTITLGSALANAYPETGNTLVQRVPQYTTVNITSTLSGTAWNSSTLTGGIIAFQASGNVTIGAGGVIDVSSMGYTGGVADSIDSSSPTNKMPGESYTGLGADGTTDTANAGGGAGGYHRSGCEGSGAGGGSYGTAGGIGATGNCGSGGVAGATYGDSALSRIYLGSGGGAGGYANDPPRANGGNGGGIVIIVSAGSIAVTGSILANGQQGYQETNGAGKDYGAGGGGAGGSIYLQGTSYSGTSNLSAAGGAGGLPNHGESGGAGGSGRIVTK